MNDVVYSGNMSRRVGVYQNIPEKNAQGEAIESSALIGERMVERIDATGSEDNDGKLIGLSVCKIRMRFDPEIFANASALFIRDFDGDWDVVGPASIIGGRNRYMELRFRKRGENFTL